MLFDIPIEVCVQDILRCVVIEAAVIVVNFITDEGVVCFEECIHYGKIFFSGDSENQAFVNFAYVPVTGNGIF